jgi:predicted Zn-dependent protease
MQRLIEVSDDPGFEWEVTLIDDDQTANAFALPGGKMAVYTGILPACKTEAGLAVVMGHEIAHVIAQHGSERLTRQQGFEVAMQLANAGDYEELARQATGYLIDQPFGRSHESEADHIGLIYMARAGYDPREAVSFWTRMAGGEEHVKGGQVNEGIINAVIADWGSTHPSNGTRVARLKALMNDALAEYRPRK